MAAWRKLASGVARFNFFAERNDRNFLALALTGVVFLLPFAANNFLNDRPILGAAMLSVIAWFVVHGFAMYRGRRLLPAWAVFAPVLGALGYAMALRGESSIYWAFPLVLLFHFVLERRVANLFNTALVALAAAPAFLNFGADIALRILATLVLTIAFANVFSHLGEQHRRREQEQEQQLALERDRLALLVHATRAGFTDWDAERNAVTYSERFKEMLGYPRDFDTSAWKSFFDLMHPADREPAREAFRAMLRRKRQPGLQQPGEALEYRLLGVRGAVVRMHVESIAQVDARGRILRLIASFQDVSRFHAGQAANARQGQETSR